MKSSIDEVRKRYQQSTNGFFVVFEGINGSGKSTLMKGVAHFLKQHSLSFRTTRAPGGTPLGLLLRNLLVEERTEPLTPACEALLFAADRGQLIEEVITPARQANEIILCDRYLPSSVAFQGYGRKLGEEPILSLQRILPSTGTPDVVILLDLPVEVAEERVRTRQGAPDAFDEESREFHERVRKGYHQLAEHSETPYLILEGTLSPEILQEQVLSLFTPA